MARGLLGAGVGSLSACGAEGVRALDAPVDFVLATDCPVGPPIEIGRYEAGGDEWTGGGRGELAAAAFNPAERPPAAVSLAERPPARSAPYVVATDRDSVAAEWLGCGTVGLNGLRHIAPFCAWTRIDGVALAAAEAEAAVVTTVAGGGALTGVRSAGQIVRRPAARGSSDEQSRSSCKPTREGCGTGHGGERSRLRTRLSAPFPRANRRPDCAASCRTLIGESPRGAL
jgi:hypothetical protein